MSERRYALLSERARTREPARDLVAIGDGGDASAAQLASDVLRLAARLPEAPSGHEAEALIACADRYRFGVALLACWARGYVAALPPSHHAQALQAIGARAALVVHDGELERGIDVREALAGPEPPRSLALRRPLGVLGADERAVTLYTSGSTGEPQVVPKTAAQLLGEVEVLTACFGGALARVLCTLPPRHIYGLLFGLLLPLRACAAFVRETPLLTDAVLAAVDRLGVDALVAVPAHLQGLTAVAKGALGPLRRVFTSGAPLRDEVFDDLTERLRLEVSEVFGSTETGGIAHRAGAARPYTPFDGVVVAAAEDGRMLLASPRLPADAAQPRLCEDVIELTANGGFVHLGRADDIVKIGGSRVSLSELERTLRGLPGVRDAAVIARALPSARGHEILAVVAPGSSSGVAGALDASSLRNALLARLPPVAVPRRFRVVAELPREATGKLRRDSLLALFSASPAPPPPEIELGAATRGATHARVELRVPAGSLYFQGHFEGWPVLPAVVQLGLIAVRQAELAWPGLGPLKRVRNLKMKQPIEPEQHLVIELTRAPGKEPGEQRVDFVISRDGAACTSGSLAFATEPGP